MEIEQHYHSRLTMALDDLMKCRTYSQQMLKLPIGDSFSSERTVYEALFVALIISYGRVFTVSNTTDKMYKNKVAEKFGNLRSQFISEQEPRLSKLHERIMEKRHTAIAHSDASSRNYQYYNNSPLNVGHNPYFPYDHEEVEWVLELVETLISVINKEKSEVAKIAFTNPIF